MTQPTPHASLTDKTVLITGAARGIGEAIATACTDAGATVLCADVEHAMGSSVAQRLGPNASYLPLDVSDESQWDDVVRQILAEHDGLDAVINNAGVLHTAPIENTSVADYLRLVSVNQLGCFLGIRAGARMMRPHGGGSIVNMSSALGMVGMANMVGYTATKFAIRGMTKAAAIELGPSGIRVNSVHPTGVRTPMSDPANFGRGERDLTKIPLRRMSDVSEVASLAVFLASDASSYCTGSEFVVDGGALAGQP